MRQGHPRDERVCPHCLHESPAWTQHDDGRWWSEVDGVWSVLDEENAKTDLHEP
jgi:hypothetical protein